MKRLTGDTIIGILIALTAVGTLCAANTLKGVSASGDPGSKLFPNIACIVILIFAIIIIIQSIIKPNYVFAGSFTDPVKRKSFLQTAMILAALGLFIIMWQYIPFLAAAIIWVFLMCMIFKQKLLFSVIYSVAVPGILYVAFTQLLSVRLDIF